MHNLSKCTVVHGQAATMQRLASAAAAHFEGVPAALAPHHMDVLSKCCMLLLITMHLPQASPSSLHQSGSGTLTLGRATRGLQLGWPSWIRGSCQKNMLGAWLQWSGQVAARWWRMWARRQGSTMKPSLPWMGEQRALQPGKWWRLPMR